MKFSLWQKSLAMKINLSKILENWKIGKYAKTEFMIK